ncbi:MAG: ATP-binding cassette domain-containing protein [Candidatus Methylumidiphilus sp.]
MNSATPSTKPPPLIFEDVTIAYSNDHLPVIANFSLIVEAGSFWAIVGPSGCGKSSLLHATAGYIRPVSGSICIGRHPILEPSLQVGFVSQRYALFPWLTVEENIVFGLRSQNLSEQIVQNSLEHLLEVIDLRSKREYYPEELSGGMQQRVALARSMAPNPPVLLLDEPFSALDTINRINMRKLLLRLWSENQTTILFVTHDLEEALLLADKLLILNTSRESMISMDIPFPRPRHLEMTHSEAFHNLLKTTSAHFGAELSL